MVIKKWKVCWFLGDSSYRERTVEARSAEAAKAIIENELKQQSRKYYFSRHPIKEVKDE